VTPVQNRDVSPTEAQVRADSLHAEAQEITPFLARLRANDPVVVLTERLIRNESPSPQLVSQTLKLLSSPSGLHWKRRVVAAWALGWYAKDTLDGAVVAHRLINLTNGYHLLDYPGRILRASLRTFVAVIMASVLFDSHVDPERSALQAMLITIVFFPACMVIDRKRANKIRAMAVRSLGRIGQLPSIPTLVNSAMKGNDVVKFEAKLALLRMLPQVNESYYGTVSHDIVSAIVRLLDQDNHALIIAAIRALGAVGGESVIDDVVRMTVYWRAPEIREAAAQSLGPIRERAERARNAATLLRPAETAGDAFELLRPVTSTVQADPGLLLRARSLSPEEKP
jgi:hypothetical protein